MIQSVLASLPASDRAQVLFVDRSKGWYANFSYIRPNPQASAGIQAALETLEAKHRSIFSACERDGDSGSFWRVSSRPGFTRLESRLTLPRKPEVRMAHLGDVAFIYTGGWGVQGGSVDAGFQYSTTFDNWTLFVSAEKVGFAGFPATRFAAGQTVQLKFYIPQGHRIAINAVGRGANGEALNQTLVVDLPQGFEWRSDGKGIILKRVTSIAQQGKNNLSGSRLLGVRWQDLRVGLGQDTHPWWPQDNQSTCRVPDEFRVKVQSQAGMERVDIDLSGELSLPLPP